MDGQVTWVISAVFCVAPVRMTDGWFCLQVVDMPLDNVTDGYHADGSVNPLFFQEIPRLCQTCWLCAVMLSFVAGIYAGARQRNPGTPDKRRLRFALAACIPGHVTALLAQQV